MSSSDAWIVALPALSALVVLVAAAMAVDYFGLLRREGWGGTADDPRPSALRARALSRQFRSLKEHGSPRTARVARHLLLTLAECDQLGDAGDVVDFLGADAVFSRVGSDPLADAMRAVALAEAGRLDEARVLAGKLLGSRRCRQLSVVRWAWARVAVLDRRPQAALAEIERATKRTSPPGMKRDLALLRAAALVKLGRTEQATDELRALVDAGRRFDVDRYGQAARQRGDSSLALACAHALANASPYR